MSDWETMAWHYDEGEEEQAGPDQEERGVALLEEEERWVEEVCLRANSAASWTKIN